MKLIIIFILPILLFSNDTDNFLSTLPYNKNIIQKSNKNTLKRVDKVLVIKSEQKIYLLSKGEVVKEYRASFGKNPKGPKLQVGDKKTPEGNYTLDYKKFNSTFHRAIHISYPNKRDRLNAKKAGLKSGGLIMLHGQTSGKLDWFSVWAIRFFNWTDGCIAVTNKEIDEIYSLVKVGTPIEIRP